MEVTYKEYKLTVEEYLNIESKMENMDTTTIEQAEKSLANQQCSIVAVDNSKIIGIGRLIGDAAIYWCIVDVWVLPEY